MDKKEVIKILHDEIAGRVDAETIEKIKNAKTKKEALEILEGASVELDEEKLSMVSGGEDTDGWCPEKNCEGLFCPGYY